MSLLEALFLGALQGLTEFLPVSSSGHLALAQHFLGVRESQVFFDVMLHLGTLLAVVAVYRRAVGELLLAGLRAAGDPRTYRRPLQTIRSSPRLTEIACLVLGSIPTALIGFLFQDSLEGLFEKPRVVATMLLVTGLWLHLPRLRRRPREGPVRFWQAPLVGVAQGLAITPGISRSGSTISTGQLLGISPDAAARFSFLLSLPAILGATALKLRDTLAAPLAAGAPADLPPIVLAAGVLTSFAVGYACLVLLLTLLRRGRFAVFSYYCFALGVGALVALA